MAKLIWRLAASFDGLIIDGGPNPGGGDPLSVNEVKGAPGQKNKGDRTTNKVINTANNTASSKSTGIGGVLDVIYAANQVANTFVANSQEQASLDSLTASVAALMPRKHGGVLVVSVFRKTGPAIAFSNAWISGSAQTMGMAFETYHARGTVSSADAVRRFWWAEIERAKDAPHSGPPRMQSWP